MNSPLLIAVLCLLAIVPSMAMGQSPATAPAATQPTTTSSGTSAAPGTSTPATTDDDFALGMLLGVLAILLLVAVVVVLAAILAAGAMFLGAVLLLLGIISSSVLIGLLRRTGRSAVRAFIIQACALAGVPMGVGALWLDNHLLHVGLSYGVILFVGAVGGLATGAAVGLAFSLVAARLGRFLLLRLQRNQPSAPLGGFPAIIPDAALKAEPY